MSRELLKKVAALRAADEARGVWRGYDRKYKFAPGGGIVLAGEVDCGDESPSPTACAGCGAEPPSPRRQHQTVPYGRGEARRHVRLCRRCAASWNFSPRWREALVAELEARGDPRPASGGGSSSDGGRRAAPAMRVGRR